MFDWPARMKTLIDGRSTASSESAEQNKMNSDRQAARNHGELVKEAGRNHDGVYSPLVIDRSAIDEIRQLPDLTRRNERVQLFRFLAILIFLRLVELRSPPTEKMRPAVACRS